MWVKDRAPRQHPGEHQHVRKVCERAPEEMSPVLEDDKDKVGQESQGTFREEVWSSELIVERLSKL